MSPYPAARPELDDYEKVLDTLNAYVQRLGQPTDEEKASDQRMHLRLRIGMLVMGLAVVPLIFTAFNPQRQFELLAAYSALLIIGSVLNGLALTRAITEQKGTLIALREPRDTMISALKSSFTTEENYVSLLLQYPAVALQFARARLADRIEVQRERTDGTFGAISKIGLFPSILAAVITAVTATKGSPAWVIVAAAVATGFLILNQNTAANFHMAAADTRLMLSLLDRTIARQEAQAGKENAAANGDHARV